jgi:hypothetical protein
MPTTTPTRKTRFSRRVPDHVTDELVNVLSKPETYEFNTLFGLVYDNLKLKNAVSGGEEMLRLRSYEKLQNLVSRGLCAKVAKTYRVSMVSVPHTTPPSPPVVLLWVRAAQLPRRHAVKDGPFCGPPCLGQGGPFCFRV